MRVCCVRVGVGLLTLLCTRTTHVTFYRSSSRTPLSRSPIFHPNHAHAILTAGQDGLAENGDAEEVTMTT